MIKTRKAMMGDLSRLCELGKEAWEASNYSTIPFNAEVCRQFFKDGLMDRDSDVLVATKSALVVGFMVATCGHLMASKKRWATEMAFYAQFGGAELLDAFLKWCHDRKVVRIDLGISQAKDAETIGRLYQQKGFIKTGAMYYQEIDPIGVELALCLP